MEEVHAGQPSHVLLLLKLGQADCALVLLLLLFRGDPSLVVLMREGVPLYALAAGAAGEAVPTTASLHQPHIVLKIK